MTQQIPLPVLYRGARERITSLLLSRPDVWGLPVPATPLWQVHDVVAHLAGVAADVVTGDLPPGPPTPDWTAGHVARSQGVPVPDLLRLWGRHSAQVESFLSTHTVWPLVLDVGAHEHDIRGAFGDAGARDSDLVLVGSKVLLRGLDVAFPLLVVTEHTTARVGPDRPDPLVTLTTSTFEAFRWRLGRRSRRQLAAMDWSADPEPFLDDLCVFGPAETDVVE